jgi:hypothetical protein
MLIHQGKGGDRRLEDPLGEPSDPIKTLFRGGIHQTEVLKGLLASLFLGMGDGRHTRTPGQDLERAYRSNSIQHFTSNPNFHPVARARRYAL